MAIAPVAPDPPLPHLVRAAIKNNWATPDCNKPAIVDSLIAPVYDPDTDPMLLIKCARVLLLCDQTQYALDHPEFKRPKKRARRRAGKKQGR